LSPSAERRSGRYFFGLHTGLDWMDDKTERVAPPMNADSFWNVAVTWGQRAERAARPLQA
jgi:hypothetical protein